MYRIKLDKEDFLRHQLFTASKSKRIRNTRIKSWILVTISFLVLGLATRQNIDGFISNYFIGVSIFTLITYPFYQRWRYRKHYEKHINENYTNRFGVESELRFEDGYIVNVAENEEGKIKITEIQEINEIVDNLFIKIKTGGSVIVPSKLPEYEMLKKQLADLVEPLGIVWNTQLDWKWK